MKGGEVGRCGGVDGFDGVGVDVDDGGGDDDDGGVRSELIGFDGFKRLVEMMTEIMDWWRWWWLVVEVMGDMAGDGGGGVMAGGSGGGEGALRVRVSVGKKGEVNSIFLNSAKISVEIFSNFF